MPARQALITGASSGIGADFAHALAERGIDLILTARRADRLEQLATTLRSAHGVSCEILVADLATDAGVAIVKERVSATPALEWLINNAGFGAKGQVADTSIVELDRMHRLHVLAPLQLTQAALSHMVPRNRGTIINVASVVSFVMVAGSVGYAATKSWLHVFTEGVYLELKGSGSDVRIQSLCPGYTVTEFHDVVGMDRGLVPRFLWLDSRYVVDASLAALERDDLLVIPSWKYRLLVGLFRSLPRHIRYRVAQRVGQKTGRFGSR